MSYGFPIVRRMGLIECEYTRWCRKFKSEYLTPHEPSGKMFFAATAEPDGRELWVTDGTQGTKLVEDIFVGEMGSNPKFLTLKNSTSLSHTIFKRGIVNVARNCG